jgi:5-(aminomethyl)-3-furanmethanol phosphate kinase
VRTDLTVVKLGGSLAFSDALAPWLAALAECAGRVVVVPGGGPFAAAVRAAQPRMGFDDRAAHHMALTAMEQYGRALVGLGNGLVLAGSPAAIERAVRDGRVPVWAPTRMALCAKDVPSSWDITSDSLAAWLAGKLGAARIVLVKHADMPTAVQANDLAARGIVDALFARFLAVAGAEAFVAGPHDHAAATRAIRAGETPGTRIGLQ